jgi:DNA-binding response OmpR family regulator
MTDTNATRPTALVIEDDQLVAQFLQFTLERDGFQVQMADDGMTAQRLIAEMPPPAVVTLDIMLPYVDGFDLLNLIRAQPAWKGVPVVVITAKSDEASVARALAAGANDYIVKPFKPNDLSALVKRLTRRES